MVGTAFHAGVLAALAEHTGWDPRRAEVVVATSAGSVTGAALRAGLSAPDVLAFSQNRPLSAAGSRLLRDVDPEAMGHPLARASGRRRTGAELGAVVASGVRRPLTIRPTALLAALVPDGATDTTFISAGIRALAGDTWPIDPLWICAVDQGDGRRVVFGRRRRPAVGLAVAASCAIPGVFRPVLVEGRHHVDGGAHSPTNADLAAGAGLDLLVVSSPMSVAAGHSLRLAADVGVRRWARAVLAVEAALVRGRGTPVVAFQPTRADMAVMGYNAMDPGRQAAVADQVRQSTLRRLERADHQGLVRRLADAA